MPHFGGLTASFSGSTSSFSGRTSSFRHRNAPGCERRTHLLVDRRPQTLEPLRQRGRARREFEFAARGQGGRRRGLGAVERPWSREVAADIGERELKEP